MLRLRLTVFTCLTITINCLYVPAVSVAGNKRLEIFLDREVMTAYDVHTIGDRLVDHLHIVVFCC